MTEEEWLKSGDWEKADSSNVAALRYDRQTRRTYVRFKSGDVYHYSPMTEHLAGQFFSAASMGKFVWHLRRMGYVGVKVE